MALEDAIRELFAGETSDAAAILAGPRDRDTAVKLAVRAGQRAERAFLPVLRGVACRSGCGACCRGVRVDVTAPEALTIARGFRETMPRDHVLAILGRVKAHVRAIRAMTLAERHRARVPCPMLDEASDRCAVHDARPMRCRAHHSLDAAECQAVLEHPDEPRLVHRYPDVVDGHEAMILGQRRALVAAGLDARSFDLPLALEVALEQEDSASRWARGERVFDAADFRWPDEAPAAESGVPAILLGAPGD